MGADSTRSALQRWLRIADNVASVADWKVPLADVRVPEEDIDAVAAVYRSGWLSMGPETERFEQAFCEYTGAREAIAVTNGTAALHLMLLAAGLGPGDEVIVPSLTFVATVNAIAYTGARPVFAEIAGLVAPWLSADAAEAAVNERTAGILTMAYGGHEGETERLARVASRHGLVLLEDAAHAAGSRLDGRHLGTFGRAGAFSLFSNKNLAVGEGGIVITDDPELAARIRSLRSHGMTTLTWDRHRGHAAGYDVVALGYNYRIDEPRAALARVRLARLDEENRRRRRADTRYRELLQRIAGITPTLQAGESMTASHHLFTAVLDERHDRDAFRAGLGAEGIQTSVHYPPAHRFSIYREPTSELPLTDAYAARAVTLPMFADITPEQQDMVLTAVQTALAGTGT
jgi:dTDP-4-amino-4,6-dideoxygalactose transaminase